MMKLLVFQHIECEHPGILRRFLAEDGISWDAVELDKGDAIPDLDQYDALWVMGGPMDVWDTEECPWLIAEKKAIKHWVHDLKKPYLGLCLGHQLLADALGGSCSVQTPAEIGILTVKLTPEGEVDPIFEKMPLQQKCLQWHSVQVSSLPENATVLASSDICEVQAMRVGDNAWSMQYHIELEPDTVSNWGEIPAYKNALEAALGPTGFSYMKSESDENMDNFMECARQLYRNFIKASGLAA